MTSIMIGFTRAVHRLGTVYGNYSLDSQATGINAAGPNGDGSGNSTITFPASPSTGQTITINNTGSGTVTITGLTIFITPSNYSGAELDPDAQLVLTWGGASWTVVSSLGTIAYIPTPVYATFNPDDAGDFITFSGGNLVATIGNTGIVRSTIGKSSGKWFWEYSIGTFDQDINISTVGIAKNTAGLGLYLGNDVDGWSYASGAISPNPSKINNSNLISYGSIYLTNDVIGIALNMDSGEITFYLNGISQGVAYSGLSGVVYAGVGAFCSSSTIITANFGASAFSYSVPSGYNSGLYE